MFDELLDKATAIAAQLNGRPDKLAVAESSAGGLVSAALLAVPGASSCFAGGFVVYTQAIRTVLIEPREMEGLRASTEPYAILLATRARERLGATWGLAE